MHDTDVVSIEMLQWKRDIGRLQVGGLGAKIIRARRFKILGRARSLEHGSRAPTSKGLAWRAAGVAPVTPRAYSDVWIGLQCCSLSPLVCNPPGALWPLQSDEHGYTRPDTHIFQLGNRRTVGIDIKNHAYWPLRGVVDLCYGERAHSLNAELDCYQSGSDLLNALATHILHSIISPRK